MPRVHVGMAIQDVGVQTVCPWADTPGIHADAGHSVCQAVLFDEAGPIGAEGQQVPSLEHDLIYAGLSDGYLIDFLGEGKVISDAIDGYGQYVADLEPLLEKPCGRTTISKSPALSRREDRSRPAIAVKDRPTTGGFE